MVEDEEKLAQLLARGLREEGNAVDVAGRGEDALWMAHAAPYDAIVLDVMLPGLDGLTVCRRLRADDVWTPVLLLTARDAVASRVEGLDAGADDYLVKPFSFDELLARLRASTRRVPIERPAVLSAGDLRLDPAARRAWRGEAEIHLSTKEFALLEAFVRRPGQVLSRVQLLEAAWDMGFESRSNVVDVYVRYLRKKVDRPFGRESLETVRGRGYRLVEDTLVSTLPIRVRLTLAFAVVMAVVLALIGAFLYHRVGATLIAGVDSGLRGQVSESLPRLGQDSDLVDPDARAGSTVAEIVKTGSVVQSTPSGLVPILDEAALQRVLSGHERLSTMSIQGLRHKWRVLAVRVPGRPQAFVVARSLESREETLHRLLREFLIVGPLGLLLASLAGYVLAASALRPVEAMRRRAGAISAQTPGKRLPVPLANDEISRLAETLNTMLDRLEDAFAHERRFLADASHELRTPLTLLRTELELALRRPRSQVELEEALRSAAKDTQRLNSLAEDLLMLAGADQDGLPIRREPIAVKELLETSRSRLARWADEEGRQLEVEPTTAGVWADRNRLEQALANLIENALRYGEGTVRVSARERGAFVELHVEDEGPGFPPAFISRAFDRFSRADDARSGDGSGLGLSIVDLIATAHGGSAGLANRPTRGADVWIAIPAAPAS